MPYFRGDTFSKLQFRVIHLNFLGCIPSTSIGIKQSHWYGSALINQFSSLIFPWGFFFSTVCWCTCWELGSRMNGWKFLEGKWFDWIREISGILSFDMCSCFTFCLLCKCCEILRIYNATFHQACLKKLWKWEQTTKSIKILSSTEPKVLNSCLPRLEVHHGMEPSLGWCYGPRERGNSWETPVIIPVVSGQLWVGDAGGWACFPKIPCL